MTEAYFREGDPVLLVYKGRKEWLSRIGKTLHTHIGIFNLGELVGKPAGTILQSGAGKKVIAYRPRLREWVMKFRHESQIIYPKDAGIIITYSDIKPGDVVVEAGTGSGSLTAYLSRAVGETGLVHTFEVREHAHNAAKRNHEVLGLVNIRHYLQDILEEPAPLEDSSIDAVILDMGEPWRALSEAKRLLKPSGTIAIFVPTYNQVERTYEGLLEWDFEKIEAIEVIERPIQLKKNAIRPVTRMIAHTGFLMFAQKIV